MGEDDFLTIVSNLLYVQHGGSGMQLRYSDLMDMDLKEILWWAQRLTDIRQAEIDQLNKK